MRLLDSAKELHKESENRRASALVRLRLGSEALLTRPCHLPHHGHVRTTPAATWRSIAGAVRAAMHHGSSVAATPRAEDMAAESGEPLAISICTSIHCAKTAWNRATSIEQRIPFTIGLLCGSEGLVLIQKISELCAGRVTRRGRRAASKSRALRGMGVGGRFVSGCHPNYRSLGIFARPQVSVRG
jgi:hypothetical protein